jgi:hypothetical protein
MKTRDEILIAEAYDKVLEASFEVRNKYGDIEDSAPRSRPTREQEQERELQSSRRDWERMKQDNIRSTFEDPKVFLDTYNKPGSLRYVKELNLTAQSTPEQIIAAAEQLAKKYITNTDKKMYFDLHRFGYKASDILKQEAKDVGARSEKRQSTPPAHKVKSLKPQSTFQKLKNKLGF